MGLLEYIEDITPDVTRRVNELKASNFEGATPEDIELYAAWTAKMQMQSDYFEQQRRQRDEMHALKLENAIQDAQTSKEALEALRDAAYAKLEAVKNGQA